MAMEVDIEMISKKAALDMGNEMNAHQVESIIRRIQTKVHQADEAVSLKKHSMWRVPPKLRNLDPEAFEPKVISIGPLHHGKTYLLPGERFKLQVLKCRNLHTKENLQKCVNIISNCAREAREQYSENIELSDEEFVEILVVDGCFLIEYLKIFSEKGLHVIPKLKEFGLKIFHVWSDIVLLENQIPFFVLRKLYEETGIFGRKPHLKLSDIFYQAISSLRREVRWAQDPEEALHLLHIVKISLDEYPMKDEKQVCSYAKMVTKLARKSIYLVSIPLLSLFYLIFIRDCSVFFGGDEQWSPITTIPCATELLKAGIKLKKKPLPIRLLPFLSTFLRTPFNNGTLELPFLSLTSQTAQLLRNLTAFERGRLDIQQHVNLYVGFMRNIIQTADDVAILRRNGILENKLGTDVEVVEFFHSLGMGVDVFRQGLHLFMEYHHYYYLIKDMRNFCKFPHHRWRASLVSNYFSTPWTFLSVLAAVVLLFMSAIQTYYTVYPKC